MGSLPASYRSGQSAHTPVMGNKQSRDRLSKEDIDFLTYHTKYTEDTWEEWYKGFKQDCPDGHLTKESFMKIYSKCFPGGCIADFCDHVFRTFDSDKNGMIDLNEMTRLVKSIFKVSQNKGKGSADTAEQRAADIFKKMDVNSDGVVTREEFVSACLEDVNLMQMLTPDSGR